MTLAVVFAIALPAGAVLLLIAAAAAVVVMSQPQVRKANEQAGEAVLEGLTTLMSRVKDKTKAVAATSTQAEQKCQKSPRPHQKYPKSELPTKGRRPYRAPKQKGNPEIVKNPEGPGYVDEHGNVWEWARDQHGGPHWDVQHPDGTHTNVGPNGEVIGPDNFPNKPSPETPEPDEPECKS
jgi:hypothetical protein